MKTWVQIVIFLTFLTCSFISYAQVPKSNVSIHWEIINYTDSKTGSPVYKLTFNNAIFFHNSPNTPYFFSRFLWNISDALPEFYLENIVSEPLSPTEEKAVSTDSLSSEFKINSWVATEAKVKYAAFYLLPLRKNALTGKVEKLISADLYLRNIPNSEEFSAKPKITKSSSSVLATGNWYKIAIQNTGIHKITGQDLTDLGIDITNLSPSHIALYGNGGGMLSEKNGDFRFDDLVENPIQIYGGSNGKFSTTDYFLFYGKGPTQWEYDKSSDKFFHSINIYDDYAYYFINVDPSIGQKLRISNAASFENKPEDYVIDKYYYYDVVELDTLNLGLSGRDWFGEIFDIKTEYSYNFGIPNLDLSKPVKITTAFAYVSSGSSSMVIKANNQNIAHISLGSSGDGFARKNKTTTSFSPAFSDLTIALNYTKATSASKAYMDYLEIQAICSLKKSSGHFLFCNPTYTGEDKIAKYRIANATSSMQVWDVTQWTHPEKITDLQQTGTGVEYKYDASEIKYFVAFDGTVTYSVKKIGKINNQNLHGIAYADMIIVSHSDFLTEANRLAQFRKENDGLSVVVVTPQQVYNEFSSGAQDISGIRDFVKYLYDKNTTNIPKYLLLFGRPNYDYRGRNKINLMFVPNYQSSSGSVITETSFRANDDFFGLLDYGEGVNCSGSIDVAVGRFPVSTVEEAKIAVNKTINYSTQKDLLSASASSGSVSNYGDWKNIMTFVADDEDNGVHLTSADDYAKIVQNTNKGINIEKIYSDAYSKVSHAGGARYPDVNTAISKRMDRGSLVFTYVGHGGGNGWATERILELSDINKWSNLYNQPLMITLTCSFGWYDRPAVSPAEMAFLNPNGGCAAFITTSRVAYTDSNKSYGIKLFENLFLKTPGQEYYTIGELNLMAKNETGSMSDQLDMIYMMGDPSMRLAYPKYIVKTDSINHQPVILNTDTLKALSKVVISGYVCQENGTVLTDFNGLIYPTVFDKFSKKTTLGNNPETSPIISFDVQNSTVFKGKSTVKNGRFTTTFIVPKDIAYHFGYGKISYYAKTDLTDACGYYDSVVVGGMSSDSLNSTKCPEIDLFMNDERFANGGLTDANPLLIAKIKDEFGINTTGSGIGHDITAILNQLSHKGIVLNDYYETETDSYQNGSVKYRLENLEEGKHHLKFRAWNILNNPGEAELEFTVASSVKLALDHVLNYPNPFTTKTSFYFEHNQPYQEYDIIVQIFTISGKLIKTLESRQLLTGYRSNAIEWDGRDDYGDKIGRGVYLYRLKVRNSTGMFAEKIEKVVIL